MDERKRTLSVQIFATDLDATAIDVARLGRYPLGISGARWPVERRILF
jgi:chemotaxis methyl-accepting protein methylase